MSSNSRKSKEGRIEEYQSTEPEEQEKHRYELSNTIQEIKEDIEYIFEKNPTSRDIEVESHDWEVEWVPIDEIDADSETHKEENNVALRERRVAVERAQLTVGEGNPLIVLGEENKLIEGYTRLELLREHFEEQQVPVYRGLEGDEPKETNSRREISQQ